MADDGRSRQRGEDISTIEQVRPLVDGALAALALVAEDVALAPAGKRSVLRVAVDRDLDRLDLADEREPVPPLTLDEVAEATKSLSSALDDSDVMGPRPYVLEVTSPGVDRPLTLPRHFRRNVGRLVRLSLTDGPDLTGRITAVRADSLTLAVPSQARAADSVREVAVDSIARAQVQVEFAHAVEPED